MKTQLNFKVSKKLANQLRADAVRNRKSLDVVGATIIKDFFDSWTMSERAAFYAKLPNKTQGRKIAA